MIPRYVHVPWFVVNLTVFAVAISVGQLSPATMWPAVNLLIWALAVLLGKVR